MYMTRTMNKSMTRIIALCLAVCMMFAFAANASAASIDTSGGSGTTPVNLTTTKDRIGGGEGGEGGGEVTPTKLNVVVPTALPMAMSDEGDVVTATDCKIINNSYGAVRVKTVTISAASKWHLTAFGEKSTLASEKVDSNQLGFAMQIGNGKQVKTTTKDATQQLITEPIAGCFMSGVGDPARNTAAIKYAAIVTPLSDAVANTTVANVVFVIEWDMV